MANKNDDDMKIIDFREVDDDGKKVYGKERDEAGKGFGKERDEAGKGFGKERDEAGKGFGKERDEAGKIFGEEGGGQDDGSLSGKASDDHGDASATTRAGKGENEEYEDVCFICRRPESKAGRMFKLPNHICVCDDCMHKTMDTVSQFDYQGMLGKIGRAHV